MKPHSSGSVIMAAVFFLSTVLIGYGQTVQPRSEKFRHERAIVPGGDGPNRLLIDVPLLAGGNPSWQFYQETVGGDREPMIIAKGGLGDLRIYDSSNREVPYLFVEPPAPEPRWTNGNLLPVAATKKTGGFEVDLGRSLRVDRLRLGGLPAPFLKRARLEASGDRSHWTLLIEEGTLFDLPDERLRRLEIEFESGEYRYLRVTWDDTASARVPLPLSASARLGSVGAPPPPLRAVLRFEQRASEPGVSRYRLLLPGPRLPIAAIEVTAGGGNILRRARVTEGRLSGGEVAPHILGTAMLHREVRGEVAAAELRIPVTAPLEAQLELAIEDGDNPPLELTSVSAVFAYLPWIYFESPRTESLTARFGYPDLSAPRYDLEAMRASIGNVHAKDARWGELREGKPGVESLIGSPVPGAGSMIDVGAFQYSRKIPIGRPGLNALVLDAAVLAHSNISDLRISGTDGRQIPYLMERLEEPLSLNLPALEKTQAPRTARPSASGSQSYYRLHLPYENLPAARLVLTTAARVFRRDVGVLIEKNPANERQEPWTEWIAHAAWSHADPETPSPALTLQIPPLKTAEAMLVVEEGDNSPLALASPKLLLPAQRMRFFRETGADLTLYYGQTSLEAPRYDLALLAPRLVGAAAEEISPGPESPAVQVKTQPVQTKLFWGILIAAVAVLIALIARLVKKGEPGE